MKCKNCKRIIDDDSIFCKWCGERQIRERKKKGEIKVPSPRQLKSGKWNIELRAEGQSITEETAALCEAKARAIRAGFLEAKKESKCSLTLLQAIDSYLEKNQSLSPSTIRGYECIKKNRFPGKINAKIQDISNWQQEIDEASETLSPKTVYNSWGLVCTVMRDNHIPPPEVRLPQRIKKDLPWLTYQQILVFVDAVSGSRFEAGALLALHSLRRSEIFGLSWENIDLKKKRITVQGARVMDKNGNFVYKKTNKNVSSQRTIQIMIPALYDLLSQRKSAGLPILDCTENSLRSGINLICKKNDLPECGVHGLRRSFASLGFHLGLSELEVQEIGGWSDHNTVHKIYLKLAKEDRLNAENKMERFYKNRGDDPASDAEHPLDQKPCASA